MKNIVINKNWTFQEIMSYILNIKDDYNKVMSSFLWYEYKEKNDFIYDLKEKIYGMNLSNWKKDRLWLFINNDIGFDKLECILDNTRKK